MNRIPLAWWKVIPFLLLDIERRWAGRTGRSGLAGHSTSAGYHLVVSLGGGKVQ